MADHSKHGYRARCNSRHSGATSTTRTKDSGAGQSNSEVPRSRNLSPRFHKKYLTKPGTPPPKDSSTNTEDQQRYVQQNVAVQASEFHIVTETGFPFFERNHSPKRNSDVKRNNQRVRSTLPSPSLKKNANVQVGTSPDRVRQHNHGEVILTKVGDWNRNSSVTGLKDNQGKQEQQRRTRSPTTVQKCFGSQRQIHDSVDQTADDLPEKLVEPQIPEPEVPSKSEKTKKRHESRTAGNKDEIIKKNKKTTDKLQSDQKHTKAEKKKSFLKLRTRGDVKSDEESESELVLEDRNFLYIPKNNERESRAHRREDLGSSPRQTSPQRLNPDKPADSGSGLKQDQGDFPPATRSQDKGDHISARRKPKYGPEDYKFCSPGRKRRLSYSPVITKSGYRSSSPESLQHSPVRRLNSRSPSPLLRLRTAGVKKPLARTSGVLVKATKSLGPPRRKTDQLDTVRSRDRNASPTTTRTLSDSELKSDALTIQELPEKIKKSVENVAYQRASLLYSDESEPDEDKLPPPPPSFSKTCSLQRSRNKPAAPTTTSRRSFVPTCSLRRSRSRSRRSLHSTSQPLQRGLFKDLSRDYDEIALTSSRSKSMKQIPAPIFFNTLQHRNRAADDSPDRTYWVSSPRFVPDSQFLAPRLLDRSTDRMYEVDLNYGSRRANLTEPQDFERPSTAELRITQGLRKPPGMVMKVNPNEAFVNENSDLGNSNSVKREHEHRPPTRLELECGLNAASNSSEFGEVTNRRSSQGDRLFPPSSPPNNEFMPTQQIKNEVERLNQDSPATQDSHEKSFEGQPAVNDSDKQQNDQLVKSLSLDEGKGLKKSDSMVINKILRMHSSPRSLKDEDGEATVKPIVFPSLVTGPAGGQGTEQRTRDTSPTKRSSSYSVQSNAFNPSAQNRSYKRKPTPGRSPPPGCAPSFSSGPGSLRDFRLRKVSSRSPSPRKSVFTTLRTRDYGNRISFRTRSPSLEKNTVTGGNAEGCTVKPTEKPAVDDEKKTEIKASSQPEAPNKPVASNAKEKHPQDSSSVEEPRSSASTKVKESDSKPDPKPVKRSKEKVDGEGKTAEPSSSRPPPLKIPRASADNVPTSNDANEPHSSHSKKRRKSKPRGKSLGTENPVYEAGNMAAGERIKKGIQDSTAKSREIKSVDQVVASQVFSKSDEPKQLPMTHTISTQYEPLILTTVSEKYALPAESTARSRFDSRAVPQIFEQHQYDTSELPPRRPHSIARLTIDEGVEQMFSEEVYALREENRRRSHSESAAKQKNRWQENDFDGYQSILHPSYSPPVYERSPGVTLDDSHRYEKSMISGRESSPATSRSPLKNVELRERESTGHKRSTEQSDDHRRPTVKNVELRERESTRHKRSTEHSDDHQRPTVKTPKASPQLDDEYEYRGKRNIEYEKDQPPRNVKTSSKKKPRTRESSLESSDSSSMRIVEQLHLSQPVSCELLRTSRAKNSHKKEVPEERKIKDRPRSPRVSPRRSDKISSEQRKVREDDSMGKMNRVDEPYQFSARNYDKENNMDDLNQRKTRKSSYRRSPEPRESRSSPPTANMRHSNKKMTVVEILPSASTEELTVLHQDRNRKSNRVEKIKTKKSSSDNHGKQEYTVGGNLHSTSMEDITSILDRNKKRDQSDKPKTKRSSTDDHGIPKGEDEKYSRNDYLLDIEDITSQIIEDDSDSRKNSNSNDETGVWSRDKWEKTVEEVMKWMGEREKSPKYQGCNKQVDGKSSCCKTRPSKRNRDSLDHEIIYVVETPDKMQTAAKNQPTSTVGKATTASVGAKKNSKSPVAEKQNRHLKDQTAAVQKLPKDQGPDLQKSTQDELEPKNAAPLVESSNGKKKKVKPEHSNKKSKISDPIDLNLIIGNKKHFNNPEDRISDNESSSAESKKSKIEVLGDPRCGPCSTRKRRKIQDSSSLTSNLSNPQRNIIEKLFGLDISITPEVETSVGHESSRRRDQPKRQTMQEQRKNNLSIDQMLQMGLVSPISNHNIKSDQPAVDKPGSNIFREEDILKETLEAGPSDPKNREQFILENGILLQLKLDKLRRQQKTESLEKLSKLSFEQALLKAEMNRREKIRAMAAGRERRDRTASSRRTSPPFPGITADKASTNARPNRSIDDMLKAQMKTPKKAPDVENLQLLKSENQSGNTAISGVSELVTTLDSKISRLLEGIQEEKKIQETTRGPGPTRLKSPQRKNVNDRFEVSRKSDFVKEVFPMNMERLRVKSENYVLKLNRRDRHTIGKRYRTSI